MHRRYLVLTAVLGVLLASCENKNIIEIDWPTRDTIFRTDSVPSMVPKVLGFGPLSPGDTTIHLPHRYEVRGLIFGERGFDSRFEVRSLGCVTTLGTPTFTRVNAGRVDSVSFVQELIGIGLCRDSVSFVSVADSVLRVFARAGVVSKADTLRPPTTSDTTVTISPKLGGPLTVGDEEQFTCTVSGPAILTNRTCWFYTTNNLVILVNQRDVTYTLADSATVGFRIWGQGFIPAGRTRAMKSGTELVCAFLFVNPTKKDCATRTVN